MNSMHDNQWRNAAAQMAGMHINPLEQVIPDQPPPHFRYRCFSSGDIEVDRIGEDFDFVLSKRHRTERASVSTLGEQYAVEVPFLRMLKTEYEITAAQLSTLRYLQQMGCPINSDNNSMNANNNNTDADGNGNDPSRLTSFSFDDASRRIACDAKVGVNPSLAVLNELMRIAVLEGKFSLALGVVMDDSGALSSGTTARSSSLIRLIENLAAPIEREIDHNHRSRAPSSSSPLLEDVKVLSTLSAGDGDSHHIVGPSVRDVERVVTAAKAIVQLEGLPIKGVKRKSHFISKISDVYAALLIQVFKSQDRVMSSEGLGDDTIDAIAQGFFGHMRVATEKEKSGPARGIHSARSRWLYNNVIDAAIRLRTFIGKHRALSVVEEILFALMCMLSSLGATSSQQINMYTCGGFSAGVDSSGYTAATLLAYASRSIENVSALPTGCPALLEEAIRLFASHFVLNLPQMLDVISRQGAVSHPSSTAVSLFSASSDDVAEAESTRRGCVVSGIWGGLLKAILSKLPTAASLGILGDANILIPVASSVFGMDSGDAVSFDCVASTLLVMTAVVTDPAVISGPSGGIVAKGLRAILAMGPHANQGSLFAEATKWTSVVTANPFLSPLSTVVKWLSGLVSVSNAPLFSTKDVTLLLSLHGEDVIGMSLECVHKMASPKYASQYDRSELSGLIASIYSLCLTSESSPQATMDALRKSHNGIMHYLLASTPNPYAPTSSLFASSNEIEAVLKASGLTIDVTPSSTAEDIIIQALTPRESSALTLNVASPKPESFYMMIVDHTALNVLSSTNSSLPPNALTMSTEVNAFASLMGRYTSAGGVLLCISPTGLNACSPHAIKMIGQWWRNRAQWLGLVPQAVLAASSAYDSKIIEACMATIERHNSEGDESVRYTVRDSIDIAWCAAFAVAMKKGGCLKTAIVTTAPTLYTSALSQAVPIESERPACINIVDLLSKLVRK